MNQYEIPDLLPGTFVINENNENGVLDKFNLQLMK